MPLSTTIEKNSLATKYGVDAYAGSLHTADPGTTGAAELTGGTPAYARKQITWSAPTNGVITGSVTFDVPSGTTVTFAGLWSATTGGNFIDKVQVTSQVFNSQGQLTVNYSYTQA